MHDNEHASHHHEESFISKYIFSLDPQDNRQAVPYLRTDYVFPRGRACTPL